ncbi:virion structural protein [Edwardsiella phage PEi21]|uniref:Uncharacterized protein n=1 Tax=Edwardsiella phage PEi21 TaxID=1325372 RepID=N0DU73_9CAUD|nr:virion structural protein [Edwardsiella phage PEi21]BAN16822.1 hypothetical protein [Edwardsiella phage PEi21]
MTGIVKSPYTINHDAAFRGMVADGELANIISKLNTDVATIPFGTAVFRDAANDNGAKMPTAASTAEQFVGVAVRELNRAYPDASAFGGVVGMDFSVITTGVIYVKVLEAVKAGDAAYARVGSTGTGDFCKSAGSAATLSVAIPGAKFVSSASAGALAKLSLVVGG